MEPTHTTGPNPSLEPIAPMTLPKTNRSKVGLTWVTLAIFVVILLLLLIFILQNSKAVEIHYLGFSGSVGFGLAMLLSAVTGSILTLLIGSARIIQLKVAQRRK